MPAPNPKSHIAGIAVGQRTISPHAPAFIIAEIGINHEGDAAVCARMIEQAATAGADAIKLQTVDPEANYVVNTESHKLFSRAMLSQEETANLFNYARTLGVEPFTTSGDFATMDWVDRLNPVAHKISSGLMNNHPLVAHAARTGRPLLISTGMATWDDIDACVEVARQAGAKDMALFHCVSLYPAAPSQLNLRAILEMECRYALPTGYSDHALGIDPPVMAVAAGACMIEKHFTLDAARDSFDHRLSLEPGDFAAMVQRIRQAEAMMGDAQRPLSAAEAEKSRHMRRIIVARRGIAKGALLSQDNVALKRPLPGTVGLPPASYQHVIGRHAARDILQDQAILEADLA